MPIRIFPFGCFLLRDEDIKAQMEKFVFAFFIFFAMNVAMNGLYGAKMILKIHISQYHSVV